MSKRIILAGVLGAALAFIIFYSTRKIQALTPEQKKKIKDSSSRIFEIAERKGLLKVGPAFRHDYDRDYPELRLLEENYEAIRRECLALLDIKDDLVDMETLGSGYTTGGIHAIGWKTFMFKSGAFIEENCAMCPETARLLKKIPGLYNAFFSVLDPHQYISPHWGYYKGFIRYHLGVIVPNNNEDKKCFIRINMNEADNRANDLSLIERGETYYWKNGEGVLFDDTFLHDAANYSDQVRVVLFLDLRKKMPFYLQLLNIILLNIGYWDPSVKQIRKSAVVAR